MSWVHYYNRMLRFVYRSNGHSTPESHFQDTLDKTERLKAYAHKSPCPSCLQKNKLQVLNYEVGKDGWEFKIQCSNCLSQGVMNDSGFHVDLTRRVGQVKRGR